MFWFSLMTCFRKPQCNFYVFVNYSNNKRIKNYQFALLYFLEELTSLMNCLQAPHGEIKRSSRSLHKRQLRNITQHCLLILQPIHTHSYILNYLAIAMALKLLCPSDTALEIAVLSAHNPAV